MEQLVQDILENNIAGPGGAFTPSGTQADFNSTPIHADLSITGKTSVSGPKKKKKKNNTPIMRRNLPKGDL